MFYNGVEEAPESQILYLSDAFEQKLEEPELELKVRMLNINKNKNQKLIERCTILKEYIQFVDKVRMYSKSMELNRAVCQTVDECIEEGILSEFLLKHKQEAIEMCIFEYNEERALKYIKEDEYEFGRAEGEQAGKKTIIINMLKAGEPDEKICTYAECNQEMLNEIKKSIS